MLAGKLPGRSLRGRERIGNIFLPSTRLLSHNARRVGNLERDNE